MQNHTQNSSLPQTAFGSPIASRAFSSGEYRYGMNGQEKDEELAGTYSAEYWQYDSRLGRRWNLDPVFVEHESGYACFANNPTFYIDTDGDVVIAATVGFFKGLFRNKENFINPEGSRIGNAFREGWRDMKFSAQIYAGFIKNDKSKSVGGRVLETLSKFTWQLPQQLLGVFFGNVSVYFGKVKSVTHHESGLTIIQRSSKAMDRLADRGYTVFSGFTLGNIINYAGEGDEGFIHDLLFKHELGHYQQSKIWGPLYLISHALPSIITASLDGLLKKGGDLHDKMPWEKGADKKAGKFWEKYFHRDNVSSMKLCSQSNNDPGASAKLDSRPTNQNDEENHSENEN